MKSSELRIGNLAQDEMSGAIIRVSGITTENQSFYVIDRDKYPLPNGWKAVPIPLTEEWLVRFGFAIDTSKHGELATLKNDFELWKSNGWKEWNLQTGGYDAESNDFSVDLKYVHQLQNLYFALTGEEL